MSSRCACTVGHECPQGSWEPIRCESGYYQDETTQGVCELCPAGFYCDDTYEPVVLFNSSYCPKGTSLEVPGDVCGILRCLWNYCFDAGVNVGIRRYARRSYARVEFARRL